MRPEGFAELESARETVLAEGQGFVDELEQLLGQSLMAGFERLRLEQAEHAGRMEPATKRALEAAVVRAAGNGTAQVIERLRSSEIWLSPLTAPHLVARVDSGWPPWMPEWLARAFGRQADRPELGALDDPSNRIWIAISSAARPMDPVLEEFGFEPGPPRLGGGRFGV